MKNVFIYMFLHSCMVLYMVSYVCTIKLKYTSIIPIPGKNSGNVLDKFYHSHCGINITIKNEKLNISLFLGFNFL